MSKKLGSKTEFRILKLRNMIVKMILYKYKQFSHIDSTDTPEEKQRKTEERERLSQIFINNKIYYPRPDQLNDPFEFKPYFTTPTDTLKLSKMRNIHIRRFVPNFNNFSTEDKVKKRKEVFQYLKNEDQINKDNRERTAEYFGVFCVSTKHDSPVMWAHYAGELTGLCIGFRPDLIDRGIGVKNDIDFGVLDKIKYVEEFPIIDLEEMYQNFKSNEDGNIEKLQAVCFTKSNEWEYEAEYRFLKKITGDSGRLFSFDKNKIAEVIIGPLMQKEEKEFLIDLVKSNLPNTNIFEGKISKKMYSIEKTLLNIS